MTIFSGLDSSTETRIHAQIWDDQILGTGFPRSGTMDPRLVFMKRHQGLITVGDYQESLRGGTMATAPPCLFLSPISAAIKALPVCLML